MDRRVDMPYFGPSDRVTIYRQEGFLHPYTGEVVKKLSFNLRPTQSLAVKTYEGIPEDDIHVLNRLDKALEQVDLPDWPADKMDAALDAIALLFEIPKDGIDEEDLLRGLALLRALGKLAS